MFQRFTIIMLTDAQNYPVFDQCEQIQDSFYIFLTWPLILKSFLLS